ncbi:hypothetical protein Poly21_29750 [Allorhodopirellula heiligendammensis]|uniref:Uncharacterized protein n=1 Tax=Allorhodopirellula heiligendammensis TaxID=2714739 RepID=A0A5C6BU55_9BACT|nr:hypothetical protein Poly21_29750 [Allorhodopirellula heiligendammensis]
MFGSREPCVWCVTHKFVIATELRTDQSRDATAINGQCCQEVVSCLLINELRLYSAFTNLIYQGTSQWKRLTSPNSNGKQSFGS